jgi:hypothetical protein
MSKAHMPPVPPENRSDKGPGGKARLDPAADETDKAQPNTPSAPEQGRTGNITQNTRNEGYQQDR